VATTALEEEVERDEDEEKEIGEEESGSEDFFSSRVGMFRE